MYKLNYNEDLQEELVYRTAQTYKPWDNITEVGQCCQTAKYTWGKEMQIDVPGVGVAKLLNPVYKIQSLLTCV